ncbi:hypothetical protein D3C72_1904060 [compost metagenome]
MRKTAEALDDVAMQNRPTQRIRVQRFHQSHATILHRQTFRMLKRHIKELPQRPRHRQIVARGDGSLREVLS